MKSAYLSEMNRLVNEYRGKMAKAEALHERYVQEPSYQLLVDESHCYQAASEICGRLAQLYAHSDLDRKEWLANQAYVERQLRVLVSLATNKPLTDPNNTLPNIPVDPPKASGPAAPAVSCAPSAPSAPAPSTSQPPRSGSKKGQPLDGISDEVVASWFRESPNPSFEAVSGMDDLLQQLPHCVLYVTYS